MMRPVHFEILADDPEKPVEFYRSIFGWEIGDWEEGDEYAGWTTRPAYTAAAAGGGVATNTANVASFAINATETFKGAFLTDDEVGSVDILICAVLFTGGDQTANNGDTIEVTYVITATDT